MAKLIPAVPKSCPNSERLLFERLGRELPDDWIVLHSLELTEHPHKMWGETDLVVISTKGVFVIEVKGGGLSCENGMWTVTTLNGREVYSKQESPWGQAGTAAATIRTKLYDDERFRGCLVGYGVALPFERFKATGAEITQEVLWDKRHRRENLGLFIGRMARYWDERHRETRDYNARQLSKPDVVAIRQLLRPDIESRFSLGSYLNSLEAELIELTATQEKYLRGMKGNSKTIVSGLAGTGKTILAFERAKEYAAEGKSVLYICFNKLLASHVAENVPPDLGEMFTVANLHSYYREVIGQAEKLSMLSGDHADSTDFYGTVMPEAFIESAITVDLEPFDIVIVDEAQDILTPAHLDALDLLVKDGLSAGGWHLFFDPKQDIYGKLSEEAQDRLADIGYASFELTANCRNTRPVATETSIVAGFECATEDAIDGPVCRTVYFSDNNDFRGKLDNEIRRLLNEDVLPQDIVMLSTFRLENSSLSGMESVAALPICDLTSDKPDDQCISFCTVQAFKGLERKCVVAIDIRDLSQQENALLHYVGLSRAQSLLVTFMQNDIKPQYERHLRDFGARLVAH